MNKQWLDSNSKKYTLIVARLKNGTATMAQVTTYFNLNQEQRTECMAAALEGKVIADFYKSTTPSRPFLTNSYRVAGYSK